MSTDFESAADRSASLERRDSLLPPPELMAAAQLSETEIGKSLVAIAEMLGQLSERIADVEDAVSELGEQVGKELGRVRRELEALDGAVAKKKQLKKIIKVLDQLEVIEEDEEE
ncbi:MAG: hypothetical protein IT384_02160 [Deltaproteobacteria bacterium]|nr:hypothetical protein [Deltaproteobacteria bacterium]